jgi:uncharacterized protein YggE
LVAAVLALALLASACAAVPQPGSPDPNFRTINVNGTGIVYGSPDIATADIAVVTRNADVKTASDENTRQMTAVLAALRALGVADTDIRTSNYNIVIEEQRDPEGNLTGTREYVITNTVAVTFRNLSVVGEGLEAAIAAGANQVSNINFSLEDTSALSADARAKAMSDALSRAEQLAGAAGVEIDRPYSISESFSFIPVARNLDFGVGGAAEVAAAVPVESGQIMVQVDVNVTYLIR